MQMPPFCDENGTRAVARMQEALTLIQRVYYMEGKPASWRAAKMRSIAESGQDETVDDPLAWARRLFPRGT